MDAARAQILGNTFTIAVFKFLPASTQRVRVDQELCTRIAADLFLTAAHGLWCFNEDTMQLIVIVEGNEYRATIVDIQRLRESTASEEDVPIRVRLLEPPAVELRPMPTACASYNLLDGICFFTVEWTRSAVIAEDDRVIEGTLGLHPHVVDPRSIIVDARHQTVQIPNGIHIMPNGKAFPRPGPFSVLFYYVQRFSCLASRITDLG